MSTINVICFHHRGQVIVLDSKYCIFDLALPNSKWPNNDGRYIELNTRKPDEKNVDQNHHSRQTHAMVLIKNREHMQLINSVNAALSAVRGKKKRKPTGYRARGSHIGGKR